MIRSYAGRFFWAYFLRQSKWQIATLTILIPTACGPPEPSSVTTSAWDSAGVVIVENEGAPPAAGGGWSVAEEATLVLGSLDGPEESQLFRVRGAFRLPDGRIVVGNSGTQEIRIYGPDGGLLVAHGGEGEGPGEFSSLVLAGSLGDSLVVVDRRLRRISLIHPDNGFVRSFTPADTLGMYFLRAWVLSESTILLQDIPLDSEVLAEGFHRNPIPLRSCDLDGALARDFGLWTGSEQVTLVRRTDTGIATLLETIPYGKSPKIAVARGLLFYADQDSYRIDVYGGDGTYLRSIRMAREPRPVSEADLEAFLDAELEGMDQDEARERRRELGEMPHGEFHPPIGALAADAQGFLFVQENRLVGEASGHPAQSREWIVFDPEGRLTGSLRLPAGLEVLDIGEDYLLGLYRNPLGVEYLYLYDLERPS